MTDGNGRVYEGPTSVTEASRLDADGAIAFAVRVHPQMQPGRATLTLRISRQCGAHTQIATVPDLAFEVLDR